MILYELLTDQLPFRSADLRKAGLAEIQRIIREDAPRKPSTKITDLGEEGDDSASTDGTDRTTRARRLRGDLDWITMKAMEKDRTRRYESATALADDILY